MKEGIKANGCYAAAILGLCLVYIAGLFVHLMDIDATQYASISMEMMRNGSYLVIKHRLGDYLDKPPLLFWLSSLSFRAFGISDFAYKLPSFLFSLLAFYSTYRFAKLYYSEPVPRVAAMMMASCQAMIMINNDVRTDTLLAGAVIFSIWQIAAYVQERKWIYLIGGSVGLSLALLAKGPIGLMVPVLAFSADWVLKRQWKNFVKWQWVVLLLIVACAITPMVYGLYRQFGSEGPYFYFWAQSFGRLTGQNPFTNEQAGPVGGDHFFFVHTFLWTFLPWTPLFLAGLFFAARQLFRSRLRVEHDQEVVTLGGFVLAFIGLSLSAYKLPHYIFVIFPLAAVIAAKGVEVLMRSYGNLRVAITGLNIFFGFALVIIAWVVVIWIFPVQKVWIWLPTAVCTILFLMSLFQKMAIQRLLLPTLLAVIVLNLSLNLQGYPALMKYQSPTVAGQMVLEAKVPADQFYFYRIHSHSLDFYAQRIVPEINHGGELQTVAGKHGWVYTDEEGYQEVRSLALPFNMVFPLPHHRVTKLSVPFLNPATRPQVITTRYLIKF